MQKTPVICWQRNFSFFRRVKVDCFSPSLRIFFPFFTYKIPWNHQKQQLLILLLKYYLSNKKSSKDHKVISNVNLKLFLFILVLAKTRAYLILAGSMLPTNDAILLDDDKNVWRFHWFRKQRESQLSLQRQCRYKIRRCLAHTRDIDAAIENMSIPPRIKRMLNLDEDFQLFLTHCDDGGVYEETLQEWNVST